MSVSARVFRTDAWIQAWIDTYSASADIKLIDLGGNGRPRDVLYLTKKSFKGFLPANTLCFAGIGCGALSTPRAEYMDFNSTPLADNNAESFAKSIKSLRWNHFYIADLLVLPEQINCANTIAQHTGASLFAETSEPAYSVGNMSFETYLAQLGSNTRLAYFNRREKLKTMGAMEFTSFAPAQAGDFFSLLNRFHEVRWGQPCYSAQSQRFLHNFIERLSALDEASVVMEAMQINGEVVSVIFDVIYGGRRYNFQSGYAENKFPKIALGAVHMGYAIQAALEAGLIYDFMAGNGKHSNYKSRIATRTETIQSLNIDRGLIKLLRNLHGFIK